VALYFGVLLGAGVVLGRKKPVLVAVRIPVVFVAIHFGFAWGFWKEVAKQVRRAVPLARPRYIGNRT
jgi:ABC-type enterobactin transport system permease subunit